MLIDGYIAPSNDVAFSKGVTFSYPTKYGDIVIRSKMAGRENVKYRLAIQNHANWTGRRKALTKGAIDNEAEERFLALLYENLVISWSTTIKAGGSEITPTQDNFIKLMTSPATKGVIDLYIEDASEEENFRAVSMDEMAGNSEAPSDGNSNGQGSETGF